MIDKEHLNIDLEFLDKKEPLRAKPMTNIATPVAVQTGKKYSWKKILMVIVGVAIIIWIIASQDNTNTSSNANNVIVGQYSCDSIHADQSDTLQPDASLKQQLESEQADLQNRANEIDSLDKETSNFVVDKTDQSSIDSYNQLIEQYNTALASYKVDKPAYDSKLKQYNAQVDNYNNYLRSYCTKN